MKTLKDYLISLRLDLKDSGALWSDPELTRCVDRAVADLSRFLPREKTYELTLDFEVKDESFTTPAAADAGYIVNAKDISASVDGDICTLAARTNIIARPVAILITDANSSITSFTIIVKGTDEDGKYIEESFYLHGGLSQTGIKYFKTITEVEIDHIAGNGAADVLDVGTATHIGIWQPLANKPIKSSSDTVTSSPAGTTYTKDTDYEMDYANGRIRLITGTTMAAATAYLIGYTKSNISIDLSTLPDFIRTDRVIYPASDLPQTFVTAELWGNILTIEGSASEGQENMSDTQHIVVRYWAEHRRPSADAAGSYRPFLDNTIILASSAYALFMKALQCEHQAVLDYASARIELARVKVYLENNTNEDAKTWLTKITTDIADLRTAVETALDAAATYIIGATVPAAKKYLDDGDAYINTVNIAERVAEKYSDYARASMELFDRLVNEAQTRIVNLRTYIEQASGWISVAREFESEAARYESVAVNNMALAERFRVEAAERRNEAWAIWKDKSQYIGDTTAAAVLQPGRY